MLGYLSSSFGRRDSVDSDSLSIVGGVSGKKNFFESPYDVLAHSDSQQNVASLSGRVITLQSQRPAKSRPSSDEENDFNSQDIPKSSFNHDQFAGSIYVTNGITGIALSIFSALKSFGKISDEIPSALGLRRYFSVLTGVSNIIFGAKMLETAKNVEHIWGIHEARIRIARGVAEATSGFVQGTVQLVSLITSAVSVSATQIANFAGDGFNCIAIFLISVFVLHNARLAGELKRILANARENVKVGVNSDDYQQSVFNAQVDALHDFKKNTENSFIIKKCLGDDFFKALAGCFATSTYPSYKYPQNLGTFDFRTLQEAEKKLAWKEFSQGMMGAVALLSVVATAVGDVFTGGLVGQIVSIIRPVISSTFLYFDAAQLKTGLAEEEKAGSSTSENTRKWMKITLTALAIGIAVGVFVGGSVASGGGLPLAVLIIGVTMPLISLMIEHRKEIWAGLQAAGIGVQNAITPIVDGGSSAINSITELFKRLLETSRQGQVSGTLNEPLLQEQ